MIGSWGSWALNRLVFEKSGTASSNPVTCCTLLLIDGRKRHEDKWTKARIDGDLSYIYRRN